MIEKEIKKKLSGILTAPKSVQLNHGWNVLTDTESVIYCPKLYLISECRHIFEYAHIVLKSIDEFLNFFQEKDKPPFNENVPFCFPEHERFFANLLNNFYIFTQYAENNIKWPKVTISKCFDNNFSYRIMYELRKQSAHVFFVIGAIEKVFKNGNFENRFIVDLDEIVKNAKIKSAVKDEINNMKEKKVDLIDLVISFKKVFLDLISNIFIDKRKEIEDSYRLLINLSKKEDKLSIMKQ